MSRGNDAIPTWSGFNYQGKIMLFYILKLMNQINKEEGDSIPVWIQTALLRRKIMGKLWTMLIYFYMATN